MTDLLALSAEGALDVAILVSSDADFIPAVEFVQQKGQTVINATWSKHGFDLAKTSWVSFNLDSVIPDLMRTDAEVVPLVVELRTAVPV